ncbi:RnfH family protein [Candidatus Pantoea edessiphila]|uniref:UPF0125 protein CRV09_01435 n=1 Tax=Candidatus Pantoea edessiphila TaxID=2044610 RepID=A0A2P5T306_9GAMM|nr:RnfH family protein [Candidatus Pantoea edessiphila]PPI88946.1 RnfH family protein [Candidatus Pantoea edessiphila]
MYDSNISVELVYAFPRKCYHFYIALNNNYTTVKQLIEKSGILQLHKEINLCSNKVGIHGKLVELETLVKEGDRIEIYRSLFLSPMELRRQRIKNFAKRK